MKAFLSDWWMRLMRILPLSPKMTPSLLKAGDAMVFGADPSNPRTWAPTPASSLGGGLPPGNEGDTLAYNSGAWTANSVFVNMMYGDAADYWQAGLWELTELTAPPPLTVDDVRQYAFTRTVELAPGVVRRYTSGVQQQNAGGVNMDRTGHMLEGTASDGSWWRVGSFAQEPMDAFAAEAVGPNPLEYGLLVILTSNDNGVNTVPRPSFQALAMRMNAAGATSQGGWQTVYDDETNPVLEASPGAGLLAYSGFLAKHVFYGRDGAGRSNGLEQTSSGGPSGVSSGQWREHVTGTVSEAGDVVWVDPWLAGAAEGDVALLEVTGSFSTPSLGYSKVFRGWAHLLFTGGAWAHLSGGGSPQWDYENVNYGVDDPVLEFLGTAELGFQFNLGGLAPGTQVKYSILLERNILKA